MNKKVSLYRGLDMNKKDVLDREKNKYFFWNNFNERS